MVYTLFNKIIFNIHAIMPAVKSSNVANRFPVLTGIVNPLDPDAKPRPGLVLSAQKDYASGADLYVVVPATTVYQRKDQLPPGLVLLSEQSAAHAQTGLDRGTAFDFKDVMVVRADSEWLSGSRQIGHLGLDRDARLRDQVTPMLKMMSRTVAPAYGQYKDLLCAADGQQKAVTLNALTGTAKVIESAQAVLGPQPTVDFATQAKNVKTAIQEALGANITLSKAAEILWKAEDLDRANNRKANVDFEVGNTRYAVSAAEVLDAAQSQPAHTTKPSRGLER